MGRRFGDGGRKEGEEGGDGGAVARAARRGVRQGREAGGSEPYSGGFSMEVVLRHHVAVTNHSAGLFITLGEQVTTPQPLHWFFLTTHFSNRTALS